VKKFSLATLSTLFCFTTPAYADWSIGGTNNG